MRQNHAPQPFTRTPCTRHPAPRGHQSRCPRCCSPSPPWSWPPAPPRSPTRSRCAHPAPEATPGTPPASGSWQPGPPRRCRSTSTNTDTLAAVPCPERSRLVISGPLATRSAVTAPRSLTALARSGAADRTGADAFGSNSATCCVKNLSRASAVCDLRKRRLGHDLRKTAHHRVRACAHMRSSAAPGTPARSPSRPSSAEQQQRAQR